MIRAKIIAEGKVQSVGYRDEVEDMAMDLGIKGFVRNLAEKDKVEIVCEADERVVDKFLESVKIKNELIDVKKLTVKKTEPTGEFKTFKIIRGDKDSETAERMDEAAKHLKGVKREIRVSREDIRDVGRKVDNVGQKVDTLTTQTNQNFKDLKGSVNSVGEKVDNLTTQTNQNFKDLKGSVDGLTTQTNQHFTDLKGSYHTFSERMLSMEDKLTKLVEYIGMLVKNHIEREEKGR